MLFQRSQTYEDWAVTLTLPSSWDPIPESRPGLLAFQDKAGMRLTVGTIRLRERPKDAQTLFEAVRDVYAVRIEEERKLMDPGDPLNTKDVKNANEGPTGVFVGTKRAKGRMFSGVVIGKGADIVTLYLEGPHTSAETVKSHMALMAKLFEGLRLKGEM